MPYDKKFEGGLWIRASGKTARNPDLNKISPAKAKAMLAEAKKRTVGWVKKAVGGR